MNSGSLSVLCTPCPAFAVSLVTTVLNRARWNPPVLSAWISLTAKMLNWFLYLRVICNSFGNCLIYLPTYRPSFWGGSLFCNALCILDLNLQLTEKLAKLFPPFCRLSLYSGNCFICHTEAFPISRNPVNQFIAISWAIRVLFRNSGPVPTSWRVFPPFSSSSSNILNFTLKERSLSYYWFLCSGNYSSSFYFFLCMDIQFP